MSKERYLETYAEDVNKSLVEKKWNDFARKTGDDMHDGLPMHICWDDSDYVYYDYEAACDHINNLKSEQKYTEVAIKFYAGKRKRRPKRTQMYYVRKERLTRLQKELENFVSDPYRYRASHSVGCKCCETRYYIAELHKAYQGGKIESLIHCPLCGEYLLSETDIRYITRQKERIAHAKELFMEAERAYDRKCKKMDFKICWLVNIEFHS